MGGSGDAYTYEAFISYRHLERDTAVAKRVQRALEGFRVPKALRERAGKPALGRCFRDEDELTPGASLSDKLLRALAASRFLIVVCSPATPASSWVDQEIEAFIEQHGRERVLTVLAEGEPEESLPQALREDEPLAADFRPGKTRREQRLEELRLAAALIGCPLDDLVQRQRQRRRAHIAAAACLALALGGGFAAFAATKGRELGASERANQIQESEALAASSQELLSQGLRMEAIQVAAAALPQTDDASDRPFVASAQNALADALGVWPCTSTEGRYLYTLSDMPDANTSSVAVSTSQPWFAVRKSSKLIETYDAETGLVKASITPSESRTDQSSSGSFTNFLVAADDRVATHCFRQGLVCFAYDSGEVLWTRDVSSITAMALSRDGQVLACTYTNEDSQSLILCSMATGELLSSYQSELPSSSTPSIYLSYDGGVAVLTGATDTGEYRAWVTSTESSSLLAIDTGGRSVSSALLSGDAIYLALPDLDDSTKASIAKIVYPSLETAWSTELEWNSYSSTSPSLNWFAANAKICDHYPINSEEYTGGMLVVSAGCKQFLLETSVGIAASDIAEFGSPIVECHLGSSASKGTLWIESYTYEGDCYRQCLWGDDPGEVERLEERSLPKNTFRVFRIKGSDRTDMVSLSDAVESRSRLTVSGLQYMGLSPELPGLEEFASGAGSMAAMSTDGRYSVWRSEEQVLTVYDNTAGATSTTIDLTALSVANDASLYLFDGDSECCYLYSTNALEQNTACIWRIRLSDGAIAGSWTPTTPYHEGNGDSYIRPQQGEGYFSVCYAASWGRCIVSVDAKAMQAVSTYTGETLPGLTGASYSVADVMTFGSKSLTLDSQGNLELWEPSEDGDGGVSLDGADIADYTVDPTLAHSAFVSPSGNAVAVLCEDNGADYCLRCFDDAGSLLWEKPMSSRTIFGRWLDDDGGIFLQDLSLNCYLIDAETGSTISSSETFDDFVAITRLRVSEDGTRLFASGLDATKNLPYLCVFDLSESESFLLYSIPLGYGVSADESKVYCRAYTTLYTLPLYDRAELLALAEETVAGHELTDEQRQAYGIG